MANPGSPEQMRMMQQQQPQPAMPKNTMVGMLVAMLIMMVVAQFRAQIGGALNFVFKYIDFDGNNPVLTLVICGTLMITLSTVIRGFFMDPLKQARSQHINREFQAEMKQARLENNLFKMKKLQEIQPKIMEMSMQQSTGMMKIMPVTMLIIIPIYAWVWYFISETVPVENLIINMPWGVADLSSYVWFMPVWIVIYTLISLPIGQLENKFMAHLSLRRRLEELDNEVNETEAEA